jgi:phage terminase Nu1 subunit (DNA packaging protein)
MKKSKTAVFEIAKLELAEGLGITVQWLNKLVAAGVIVETGRGKADLWKSIAGYVKHQVDLKLEAAEPSKEAADFDFERARKLKLQNDETEDLLVPVAAARAAVDAAVGTFISEMHGIPSRITTDVALRGAWETEIDRVITGINARCRKAGDDLAAGRDPLADQAKDDA